MESSKIMLTTQQVGEYLGVNAGSVNRWIKQGKLKVHTTSEGDKRIFLKAVYAFVKAHGFPSAKRRPKVA